MPQIVAATNYSTGGRGEYPARYVVLKWTGDGDYHKYSRHMQVNDGKNDDHFIFGHYYFDLADAYEDMINSMNDNNKSYPLGNISHIPGIDFDVKPDFGEV